MFKRAVLFFILSVLGCVANSFAAVNCVPNIERFRDGIPHFLSKLTENDEVRIAYFGGSITAADGWRVQTLAGFSGMYPNTKFVEINAAIGGTGSDLGVFRQEFDVLRYKPDLVFVEFCVNDGGTSKDRICKQMEGIVRQIWKHDLNTDIVFVYTYRLGHENEYLVNKLPASVVAMEEIAEFYGIPTLDFNPQVVEMHEEGKLTYQAEEPEEGKILFSKDGVHPLKEGHEIYTKIVCNAFEKMRLQNEEKNFPSVELRNKKLARTPFDNDNYEAAKLVPIKESQLSGEWRPLENDSPLAWTKQRLGDAVFTSDAPGAMLSFKFKGSYVGIYDVLGPNAGQVWITVDGKKSNSPVPRFDSFCTYHRLATLEFANALDPNIVHEVKVVLDSEQPDRSPVRSSLQDPEKELAEQKFQGRNVWFGPVMVIGEIVE